MIQFFAAALPEATDPGVGDLAVRIGVVLVLILQILSYFRRQPTIEAEFATKQELQAARNEFRSEMEHVDSKLEQVRNEGRKQFDQMMQAGEHRSENIFRRINDVSLALNEKIDGVPLQVIQTLKNTGAI